MKRKQFFSCFVQLQVDAYGHNVGDCAAFHQEKDGTWYVAFFDTEEDVAVSPADFIILSVHHSRVHKGDDFIILCDRGGLHAGSLVFCTKVVKYGAYVIDGDEKECFVPFSHLGYLDESERPSWFRQFFRKLFGKEH